MSFTDVRQRVPTLASTRNVPARGGITPIQYVQSVVAHLAEDRDITQRRVYHSIAPLFVFASVLVVFCILPRLASVKVWLSDVAQFKLELGGLVVSVCLLVWAGLAAMKWMIRMGARMILAFVEDDFHGLTGEAGVPQSYELVLGGFL
ncbi:hypothetical protein CYLTODRAFT_425038 [Cylindrobasidium torrendii FP15055 ss-10]|uniref:Uncharacterized protein n=1 Tax=Cylindrobasidium torrendii FP15055 ss-10 TaxID=1314674 RepID=A0A0D7B1Y0_9AGAR|nr:hypothetical protein CYLTODRAFT_425038 [Cylindrobasidium torrendii FP15055 ss-10]